MRFTILYYSMIVGYIPTAEFSSLLSLVLPPLGVRGLSNERAVMTSIVMSVDIPNRNGRLHFLEVLHALAGRVAGTSIGASVCTDTFCLTRLVLITCLHRNCHVTSLC